jgi:PA14 domain
MIVGWLLLPFVAFADDTPSIPANLQEYHTLINQVNSNIQSLETSTALIQSNIESITATRALVQQQLDTATVNLNTALTKYNSDSQTVADKLLAKNTAQYNYDNNLIKQIISNGVGLTVKIYNNTISRTPDESNLCRTDTITAIAANWGGGSVMGCNNDRVTIHYYGTIIVPQTTSYQFKNIADDGFYMTINNQLVINEWRDKGCGGNWGTPITLTAGVPYALDAWFYENGGGACSTLYYQTSTNWAQVPASWFGLETSTVMVKDPALLIILNNKTSEYQSAVDSFTVSSQTYTNAKSIYDSLVDQINKINSQLSEENNKLFNLNKQIVDLRQYLNTIPQPIIPETSTVIIDTSTVVPKTPTVSETNTVIIDTQTVVLETSTISETSTTLQSTTETTTSNAETSTATSPVDNTPPPINNPIPIPQEPAQPVPPAPKPPIEINPIPIPTQPIIDPIPVIPVDVTPVIPLTDPIPEAPEPIVEPDPNSTPDTPLTPKDLPVDPGTTFPDPSLDPNQIPIDDTTAPEQTSENTQDPVTPPIEIPIDEPLLQNSPSDTPNDSSPIIPTKGMTASDWKPEVAPEEYLTKDEIKTYDAIGLVPNNPNQLPDSIPKLLDPVKYAELLQPHVQVDVPGVENGGITFFGTKTAPQVIGEDGQLTPPAPPPGSGLPIPPDAITTSDTFIGQPGGITFNAPDIAVPVALVPLSGAIASIPGAEAINQAFVTMANIGNDMSPVTRKKAKKVLIATIVAGQVGSMMRRFK